MILDQKFKNRLENEFPAFIKSEKTYKELGIPWKRGVIFRGVNLASVALRVEVLTFGSPQATAKPSRSRLSSVRPPSRSSTSSRSTPTAATSMVSSSSLSELAQRRRAFSFSRISIRSSRVTTGPSSSTSLMVSRTTMDSFWLVLCWSCRGDGADGDRSARRTTLRSSTRPFRTDPLALTESSTSSSLLDRH